MLEGARVACFLLSLYISSPFTPSQERRPSTFSLHSLLSCASVSSWYKLLPMDLISASNERLQVFSSTFLKFVSDIASRQNMDTSYHISWEEWSNMTATVKNSIKAYSPALCLRLFFCM